jgi:FdhD protein
MEIRRLDQRPRETSPLAAGTLAGPGGAAREAVWAVAEEVPLAVLLNGESFAVMMATPADLEDFAVGFAITEGIVPDAAAIASLRIAEAREGYALNLRIDPALVEASALRRRTLAGRAGCGVCGAQTIEAALPPPKRVAGPLPAPAAVLAAARALPALQPMKRLNRSTHAAAFCAPDGTVELVREDIGRHNALDKLAGALARAGRPGSDGFVLLSSRLSVEMVQKTAALGAPFVAAVSAPSALALRTADAAGLTVAALAPEGLMVFDRRALSESAA